VVAVRGKHGRRSGGEGNYSEMGEMAASGSAASCKGSRHGVKSEKRGNFSREQLRKKRCAENILVKF
jgi:hypothetical protein